MYLAKQRREGGEREGGREGGRERERERERDSERKRASERASRRWFSSVAGGLVQSQDTARRAPPRSRISLGG